VLFSLLGLTITADVQTVGADRISVDALDIVFNNFALAGIASVSGSIILDHAQAEETAVATVVPRVGQPRAAGYRPRRPRDSPPPAALARNRSGARAGAARCAGSRLALRSRFELGQPTLGLGRAEIEGAPIP
jgi:hypothetical protein